MTISKYQAIYVLALSLIFFTVTKSQNNEFKTIKKDGWDLPEITLLQEKTKTERLIENISVTTQRFVPKAKIGLKFDDYIINQDQSIIIFTRYVDIFDVISFSLKNKIYAHQINFVT